MSFVYLSLGLVLLVAGAESLVRGASRVAAALGISSLVIGLTVVALGTSMPEMAVSTLAGITGQGDIAVGNVVGSNIFNVLFILGISALITPLVVSKQLIRLDVPLMIAVSVLALLLGLDGNISRIEGIGLFAGIVCYTVFLFLMARKEPADHEKTFSETETSSEPPSVKLWIRHIGLIIGGLILLVVGSKLLLNGAVSLARYFGISELIIGLTLVAAGTSLPEVATSVIASIRGERDIAIGNVVGSNIFNLLTVLGISAIAAPKGIVVSDTALQFDFPVMCAVAILCLPIFFTGSKIDRFEGLLLLFYYLLYVSYLILTASKSLYLPGFHSSLLWGVIPFTALFLLISTIRSLNTNSRKNSR